MFLYRPLASSFNECPTLNPLLTAVCGSFSSIKSCSIFKTLHQTSVSDVKTSCLAAKEPDISLRRRTKTRADNWRRSSGGHKHDSTGMKSYCLLTGSSCRLTRWWYGNVMFMTCSCCCKVAKKSVTAGWSDKRFPVLLKRWKRTLSDVPFYVFEFSLQWPSR